MTTYGLIDHKDLKPIINLEKEIDPESKEFVTDDEAVIYNPNVSMKNVYNAWSNIYNDLSLHYKFIWTKTQKRLTLKSKMSTHNNKLFIKWFFCEKFPASDENNNSGLAGKYVLRVKVEHTLYPFFNINLNMDPIVAGGSPVDENIIILRTESNILPIEEIILLAKDQNIEISRLPPTSAGSSGSSSLGRFAFAPSSSLTNVESVSGGDSNSNADIVSKEQLARLEAMKERERVESEAKELAESLERKKIEDEELAAKLPLDFLPPPPFQEQAYARFGAVFLGNHQNGQNEDQEEQDDPNHGMMDSITTMSEYNGQSSTLKKLSGGAPAAVKKPIIDGKRVYKEHDIHTQILFGLNTLTKTFPPYLTVSKYDSKTGDIDTNIHQTFYIPMDIQSVYERDYNKLMEAGQMVVKYFPLVDLYENGGNGNSKVGLGSTQLKIHNIKTSEFLPVRHTDQFSLVLNFKEELKNTFIHKASLIFNEDENAAKDLNELKITFLDHFQKDALKEYRNQRQWQHLIPTVTNTNSQINLADNKDNSSTVSSSAFLGLNDNGDTKRTNAVVSPAVVPLSSVATNPLTRTIPAVSNVVNRPPPQSIATIINTNTNNSQITAMSSVRTTRVNNAPFKKSSTSVSRVTRLF